MEYEVVDHPVQPFVKFDPSPGGLDISWGLTIKHKEMQDGSFNSFVPGFDLYFSAKDRPSANKKAAILTRFFFDHFFVNSGKSGLKKLVLRLHTMGFKAVKNDFDTVHKLINNKIIAAKFKVPELEIPVSFQDATTEMQESSMAVAI